jgi:hypothetical protein
MVEWSPQHWRLRGSYVETADGWYCVSPIMTFWQVEFRTKDTCEILDYFNLEGLAQAYVERILTEQHATPKPSAWKTGKDA